MDSATVSGEHRSEEINIPAIIVDGGGAYNS